MLIPFQRVAMPRLGQENAEEDNITRMPEIIHINPAYVMVVFSSERHQNCSIIRLSDGRGFVVRGTTTEVVSRLEAREISHVQN